LVFSKSFRLFKSGIFSGGNFPSFGFSKMGSGFWFNKFRFKLAQVSKISFKIFSKILVGKFRHSPPVGKIGFSFSKKVLASLVQAFLPGSLFLAK